MVPQSDLISLQFYQGLLQPSTMAFNEIRKPKYFLFILDPFYTPFQKPMMKLNQHNMKRSAAEDLIMIVSHWLGCPKKCNQRNAAGTQKS